MDGTYLTQLRTGALSGAATDILAKKDSKNFLIIGTGGQALTQVEAVLEIRNIEKLFVCDLDIDRAKEFKKKISEKYPDLEIKAIDNANDYIEDMDIITTVTTSKKPVFEATNLKKGTHINSVGSYTPDMQETPAEVLEKADKIFLDTIDGVMNESGDVINPIKEKIVEKEKVEHELGDLINNKESGRENDEEITWFKTTGSAVVDIVVAEKIYKKAMEKNLGSFIEL
ncbi:MAG: hypothetical protein Q4B52_03205 [Tissierellia bacterium]|nr:hypothetical protein [Tissierellia bacterium]